MVRAYIYLVSFKNTNDIYIGQTKCKNVFDRLKQHKRDKLCAVHLYVKHKLNNDWSKVSIDIIDSFDMDEDSVDMYEDHQTIIILSSSLSIFVSLVIFISIFKSSAWLEGI
jgi:hypothetical protein